MPAGPDASGTLPRRPTLIVVTPSGARSRVPLSSLPFGIGRQADNHLILRDNRASRNHARIVQDSGDYYVEDLKSSHGVFVNGVKVKRQRLYASDRIEFGIPDSYSAVLTFDDDEIQKILDQFPTAASAPAGAENLGKLRALVDVARAIQHSLTTEDVLAAVVDAALAITGFERGFLLLNRNGSLKATISRNRHGPVVETLPDLSLAAIQTALQEREQLLSMTLGVNASGLADRTVKGSESSRNVVGIPLVRARTGSTQETAFLTSRNDTVGVIYLDSRQTALDLTSGNRELLQTLALEASTILENARLLEEERIKHRMEEELSIAREIQMNLLPRKLPVDGWFRAAGSSIPSHEVSGDCFDVRQVHQDLWAAVVTDVSGKGVSSALLAALLQGSFLLAPHGKHDINQMMSQINLFLNERTEGEKYATVFYCTIGRDGTLRWMNAGHVTPFLACPDGKLRVLGSTGTPLGLLATADYGIETVQMHPGDKIIAYSDGLSEAQNAHGQFFEAQRMKKLIAANAGRTAAELHKALMGQVESFTEGALQRDDITALVMEFRG
jgi:phosphoserine phosphatase RsbU/P